MNEVISIDKRMGMMITHVDEFSNLPLMACGARAHVLNAAAVLAQRGLVIESMKLLRGMFNDLSLREAKDITVFLRDNGYKRDDDLSYYKESKEVKEWDADRYDASRHVED